MRVREEYAEFEDPSAELAKLKLDTVTADPLPIHRIGPSVAAVLG